MLITIVDLLSQMNIRPCKANMMLCNLGLKL